jgi:hypothetical protein
MKREPKLIDISPPGVSVLTPPPAWTKLFAR